MNRRAVLAIAIAVSSISAFGQDKPAIDPGARDAVMAMGKTLASTNLAFHNWTIREYSLKGQPLHIVHSMDVRVHRPDGLAADIDGDDGMSQIVYDGKTLFVYSGATNHYVSLPTSGTITDALAQASKRLGVDFPLADLLSVSPGDAFMEGVTTASVDGTAMIEGTLCLHMFFTQPPGIEIELWTEKNPSALPRRIVVTYRSLPGEPRFIATLKDWRIGERIPDSAFAFRPPRGATEVRP